MDYLLFFFFEQKKCERYWPLYGEDPITFAPFKISCVSTYFYICYLIRKLALQTDKELIYNMVWTRFI